MIRKQEEPIKILTNCFIEKIGKLFFTSRSERHSLVFRPEWTLIAERIAGRTAWRRASKEWEQARYREHRSSFITSIFLFYSNYGV